MRIELLNLNTRIIIFEDANGFIHIRKMYKNNTFICKGKTYEVRIEELENEQTKRGTRK